jgi:hypothetical protein
MRFNRRRSSARFALVLGLQLGGCTTWRLEGVAPAELIARDHPAKIRVRGPRQRPEVLYRPEIRGDTLVGRHRAHARTPDRSIALTEVTSVATSHVNAGKTVGLGLGHVAVLGGALLIAVSTIDGPFDNLGQ